MKKLMVGFSAMAVCLSAVTTSQATDPISIRVFPAYAPRGPVSPNWTDYVDNAINALEVESPSAPVAGERFENAAAYEQVLGPVSPVDMIYTDFPSYLAMAAPSSAFAALDSGLQGEFGNRVHFGLHIRANGDFEFSLSELEWSLDSNDDTNYFDQSGSFADGDYSLTRVGIDYGADGLRGTDDDIRITSGPGTTPVNELMYVGVGDGFFSSEPEAADDQADIDATLRSILTTCADCEFDVAAIYTLNSASLPNPLVAQSSIKVSVPAGLGGDFNHDRVVDATDKDMLTVAVASGENDILFDVNNDQLVDFDDLEMTVHDIANTYFGDADCNGEFNSTDLVKIFIAGKYETGDPAVWSTGDWSGDGVFSSTDLIVAFQDGGYELGPKTAVAAVPEPSSIALSLLGGLMLLVRRRTR